MVCLACGEASPRPVCDRCGSTLHPAPHAVLDTGLVVRSAFTHVGSAKGLVHGLKYQGVRAVAAVLAPAMAEGVPADARALVPVPRSFPRRVRYGIDPGWELAMAVQRLTGLRVVECLRSDFFHRPNAGRGRPTRSEPGFVLRRPPPPGHVLVDDVLTTGLTLGTAHSLLGGSAVGAVTATRAIIGRQNGGL